MTETRLPPQAMSLRARVEQLPVYTPDCTDGPRGGVIPFMLEEPLSGEWVKLADVLALLPPETAETPTPPKTVIELLRHFTVADAPVAITRDEPETAETPHYADGGPCPKCGREMGHASGLGQCGACQMLDYGYFTPKCPHSFDLTRVICPKGCRTP
jgi:hypothetical protein